jgi:hypothetical protein
LNVAVFSETEQWHTCLRFELLEPEAMEQFSGMAADFECMGQFLQVQQEAAVQQECGLVRKARDSMLGENESPNTTSISQALRCPDIRLFEHRLVQRIRGVQKYFWQVLSPATQGAPASEC